MRNQCQASTTAGRPISPVHARLTVPHITPLTTETRSRPPARTSPSRSADAQIPAPRGRQQGQRGPALRGREPARRRRPPARHGGDVAEAAIRSRLQDESVSAAGAASFPSHEAGTASDGVEQRRETSARHRVRLPVDPLLIPVRRGDRSSRPRLTRSRLWAQGLEPRLTLNVQIRTVTSFGSEGRGRPSHHCF